MSRFASSIFASVASLAIVMIFVAGSRTRNRGDWRTTDVAASVFVVDLAKDPVSVFVVDLAKDPGPAGSLAGSTTPHSVIIRKPDGPPRIELAGMDPQGRTGSVACSTCHSVRKPNLENVSATTLDEFHRGMTFDHGKIACYACHNSDGSDTLRLADGKPVEYENVMTLCAQCHGLQMTAFAHGAHGGMNGHWDLTRGPQLRNNCIDCHDPHAPNYPKMIVGFKPKDRFNEPSVEEHDPEGAASHGDQ